MSEAMKKLRLREAQETVRLAKTMAAWRRDATSLDQLQRALERLEKVKQEAGA